MRHNYVSFYCKIVEIGVLKTGKGGVKSSLFCFFVAWIEHELPEFLPELLLFSYEFYELTNFSNLECSYTNCSNYFSQH